MFAHDSKYDILKRKAVLDYFNQSNAIPPVSENPVKRDNQLLDLFRELFSPKCELTDIGSVIRSHRYPIPNLNYVDISEFGQQRDIYEFTNDGSDMDTSWHNPCSESSPLWLNANSTPKPNMTCNETPLHPTRTNSTSKEPIDRTDAPVGLTSTFNSVSLHKNIMQNGKPMPVSNDKMSFHKDQKAANDLPQQCSIHMSDHSLGKRVLSLKAPVATSDTDRAKTNCSSGHSTNNYFVSLDNSIYSKPDTTTIAQHMKQTIQIINEPWCTNLEPCQSPAKVMLPYSSQTEIDTKHKMTRHCGTEDQENDSALKLSITRIGPRRHKIGYRTRNDVSVISRNVLKRKRKLQGSRMENINAKLKTKNQEDNGILHHEHPHPAKRRRGRPPKDQIKNVLANFEKAPGHANQILDKHKGDDTMRQNVTKMQQKRRNIILPKVKEKNVHRNRLYVSDELAIVRNEMHQTNKQSLTPLVAGSTSETSTRFSEVKHSESAFPSCSSSVHSSTERSFMSDSIDTIKPLITQEKSTTSKIGTTVQTYDIRSKAQILNMVTPRASEDIDHSTTDTAHTNNNSWHSQKPSPDNVKNSKTGLAQRTSVIRTLQSQQSHEESVSEAKESINANTNSGNTISKSVSVLKMLTNQHDNNEDHMQTSNDPTVLTTSTNIRLDIQNYRLNEGHKRESYDKSHQGKSDCYQSNVELLHGDVSPEMIISDDTGDYDATQNNYDKVTKLNSMPCEKSIKAFEAVSSDLCLNPKVDAKQLYPVHNSVPMQESNALEVQQFAEKMHVVDGPASDQKNPSTCIETKMQTNIDKKSCQGSTIHIDEIKNKESVESLQKLLSTAATILKSDLMKTREEYNTLCELYDNVLTEENARKTELDTLKEKLKTKEDELEKAIKKRKGTFRQLQNVRAAEQDIIEIYRRNTTSLREAHKIKDKADKRSSNYSAASNVGINDYTDMLMNEILRSDTPQQELNNDIKVIQSDDKCSSPAHTISPPISKCSSQSKSREKLEDKDGELNQEKYLSATREEALQLEKQQSKPVTPEKQPINTTSSQTKSNPKRDKLKLQRKRRKSKKAHVGNIPVKYQSSNQRVTNQGGSLNAVPDDLEDMPPLEPKVNGMVRFLDNQPPMVPPNVVIQNPVNPLVHINNGLINHQTAYIPEPGEIMRHPIQNHHNVANQQLIQHVVQNSMIKPQANGDAATHVIIPKTWLPQNICSGNSISKRRSNNGQANTLIKSSNGVQIYITQPGNQQGQRVVSGQLQPVTVPHHLQHKSTEKPVIPIHEQNVSKPHSSADVKQTSPHQPLTASKLRKRSHGSGSILNNPDHREPVLSETGQLEKSPLPDRQAMLDESSVYHSGNQIRKHPSASNNLDHYTHNYTQLKNGKVSKSKHVTGEDQQQRQQEMQNKPRGQLDEQQILITPQQQEKLNVLQQGDHLNLKIQQKQLNPMQLQIQQEQKKVMQQQSKRLKQQQEKQPFLAQQHHQQMQYRMPPAILQQSQPDAVIPHLMPRLQGFNTGVLTSNLPVSRELNVATRVCISQDQQSIPGSFLRSEIHPREPAHHMPSTILAPAIHSALRGPRPNFHLPQPPQQSGTDVLNQINQRPQFVTRLAPQSFGNIYNPRNPVPSVIRINQSVARNSFPNEMLQPRAIMQTDLKQVPVEQQSKENGLQISSNPQNIKIQAYNYERNVFGSPPVKSDEQLAIQDPRGPLLQQKPSQGYAPTAEVTDIPKSLHQSKSIHALINKNGEPIINSDYQIQSISKQDTDSHVRRKNVKQESCSTAQEGKQTSPPSVERPVQPKSSDSRHTSSSGYEQVPVCSACLTTARFLCSGCAIQPYCSQLCQKQDWIQHKAICRSRNRKQSNNKDHPVI